MDRYKCPFHGPITGADGQSAVDEKTDGTMASCSTSAAADAHKIDTNAKPWTDRRLMNEIEQQTGQRLDYGVGVAKHTGTRRSRQQPSDNQLRRQRLERKLLNRSTLNRIGETLDAMQKTRNERRFQHQFTYAIPPK